MNRLPRAHGRHIRALDLPPAELDRLESHGVVSELQLRELTESWARAKEQFPGLERDQVLATLSPHVRRSEVQEGELKDGGLEPPEEQPQAMREDRKETADERTDIARMAEEASTHLPDALNLAPKRVAPPWDQGRSSMCTAFSGVGVRTHAKRTVLSPNFSFEASKERDGLSPERKGTYLWSFWKGAAEVGFVPEAECPMSQERLRRAEYEALKGQARFQPDLIADLRLDTNDMHAQAAVIELALAGAARMARGPMPIHVGVRTFRYWAYRSVREAGLIHMPPAGAVRRSGHAMAVVGYCRANRNPLGNYSAFLVRNSWGTGWAAKNPWGWPGYAIMPYDYFRNSDLCWEVWTCVAETPPSMTSYKDWLRAAARAYERN